MKKDVADAFEVIDSKLDDLKEKFEAFKDFEEKIDKTIEDKVFEIKAIAYLTLIITAILLFLAIGILLKAIGF